MYRMSAQTNKILKPSAREGSIAVTNLTDLFLARACVCIHFWKYLAVFYGKKLSQGKKFHHTPQKDCLTDSEYNQSGAQWCVESR